jgi:alpha-D-ribose 1-methylphosphonate 5-triphosphate diphosphatase PhnM
VGARGQLGGGAAVVVGGEAAARSRAGGGVLLAAPAVVVGADLYGADADDAAETAVADIRASPCRSRR